jgi:hypothetical protein
MQRFKKDLIERILNLLKVMNSKIYREGKRKNLQNMKVPLFFIAGLTMIILLFYSFFQGDVIMSEFLVASSILIGLFIIKKFKLPGFDS